MDDGVVFLLIFFFYGSGDHRDLPVLTHSFPTRRSSDLSIQRIARPIGPGAASGSAWLGVSVPQLPWELPPPIRPASSTRTLRPCSANARPQARPTTPPPTTTTSAFFSISGGRRHPRRSEEHTSELQSLMRISYAVFCLKKKNTHSII